MLFEELTREQINNIAADAIAVVPTAAIEQHGPHLPVVTDTLLCTTIAARTAAAVKSCVPVVITPPIAFGSSHHHLPFGGTLSLTSDTFLTVLREVVVCLVDTGFRKIMILNGHGGNSDLIGVAGQDVVSRLDCDAAVATCDYWNVAKPALRESGLISEGLVPGHAGLFETSLVLAVRPELVDAALLANVADQTSAESGLDASVSGATIQSYGVWQNGAGYTDNPAAGGAELGEKLLELIVHSVGDFLRKFYRQA